MAGHRGVRAAAHKMLMLLMFVCGLLADAASGLQNPRHHASMYSDGRRPPPVIAVDLGNTNSCAAGYGPGNDDAMFRFCIPSWVAFADNGTVLVGEAAKNHAHADPGNAIFGFKRLLGLRRNYMDEEETVQRLIDRVPYKIGPRNAVRPIVQIKSRDDDGGAVKQEFDVEELASLLIGELKRKAEDHLGRKVRRAVMAVPQHFHGPSTRAAVDAAQIAGLDVVRTVSDPVAAAAAYGLRGKKTLLREGGAALVLHVGGGTAAATVLTPVDGYLEALAHRDDPFLGGDDFDRRVVDHFVGLIEAEHGVDVGHDRVALGKLRAACERAKKALSSQDHARVSVESLFAGGVGFSETLSRSDFEALNEDLFRRVVALVDRVVGEAELERSCWDDKIDEIVHVGGSTMIPRIQKLVNEYFDGKEPSIMVKPDEVVALGAAVHAHSS